VLEFNNRGEASMAYVDIVTALAVLQFFWFAMRVGKARETYGIKAPATSGNEIFERHMRVQQNSLEQLIIFLPGLYMFARYFNPWYAAGLGVVFLIGRHLYAIGYVKDPARRSVGFLTGFFPTMILVFGGLVGAIKSIFFH
jgi:glutathione S-transferase